MAPETSLDCNCPEDTLGPQQGLAQLWDSLQRVGNVLVIKCKLRALGPEGTPTEVVGKGAALP